MVTGVEDEGLHADPPALELAEDGAQLRQRVASVLMVAKNCLLHALQRQISRPLEWSLEQPRHLGGGCGRGGGSSKEDEEPQLEPWQSPGASYPRGAERWRR